MVCTKQGLIDFKFSAVPGGLSVEVPWWSANVLRTRLRAKGIRATACFDPMTHTASLELDRNADLDIVRALLDGVMDRSRAG